MKRTQTKKLAVFLAATLSALSLSGCGKNSDPHVGGMPVGGYGTGVYAPGGCIPIGGQIPFQAQGIYFDSANIRGGRAQSGQQIGNIIVGQGPVVGGPFSRSGANGTISMDLIPTQPGYQSPQGWGYYNGPVNGQGYVQISPLALQELQMAVATGQFQVPGATPTSGYTPGYPQPGYPQPGYPQPGVPNLCVSGVTIDIGHYNTVLHSGFVYLYLNNSNVAYPMQF